MANKSYDEKIADEYYKVHENLEWKFTSGNSVPVERNSITKEEWNAIKEYINHLEVEIIKNKRSPL